MTIIIESVRNVNSFEAGVTHRMNIAQPKIFPFNSGDIFRMNGTNGSMIPHPSKFGIGRMLNTKSRQLMYMTSEKGYQETNRHRIAQAIDNARFASGPAAEMTDCPARLTRSLMTGTRPQQMPNNSRQANDVGPITLNGFSVI